MVALHAGPRPFWRIVVSDRRVPSGSMVMDPSPERRVWELKTKRSVRASGGGAAAAATGAAGAGGAGRGVAEPQAASRTAAIVDEARVGPMRRIVARTGPERRRSSDALALLARGPEPLPQA